MTTAVLCVSIPVLLVIALWADAQTINICTSETINACGECIRTDGCQWCSGLGFEGSRCNPPNDSIVNCGIVNPLGREISRQPSPDQDPAIDITSVNLELRVGVPFTFQVTVTPRRNLPLDLYVLIDLSRSMADELNTLKMAAGNIANRISGVTQNVRIGLGAFNDKITYPFVRVCPPDANGVIDTSLCPPTYAFSHLITLTADIPFFNTTIQDVGITTNVDEPENGLEGLAQVVACEDIIGWRSREGTGLNRGLTRIVLFMTDDAFHYSGEAQLAGILRPYEGNCLLEESMDPSAAKAVNFTRWIEVDYPSVGRIVSMLQQREVAVIFAVTSERIQTYRNLQSLIQTPASVAELQSDASALLTLIDTEYQSILSRVSLIPEQSEDLSFSIAASCPPNSIQPTSSRCTNVSIDQSVVFDVSVTLQNCDAFSQPGTMRTHRVATSAFGDFIINYSGLCDCDCVANAERPSSRCSGNGDFECGVCVCYQGWCGSDCSVFIGDQDVGSVCPRGDNGLLCSGNGRCNCECICNPPYSGDACQCNDNDPPCPPDGNNRVCSGRGFCCSGMCICDEDEKGFRYRDNSSTEEEDCSCPPEEVVCVDPSTNLTCSGDNGECGCTRCNCRGGFFGTYCQSRIDDSCNDPMDVMCITQCRASGNFNVCRECEYNRPILFVDSGGNRDLGDLTRNDVLSVANERLGSNNNFSNVLDCIATIDDCNNFYYVVKGTEMITIIVEREVECEGRPLFPFPAWAFAPILLGVLLVLGIIIFVLIRIIISILDYLEVKRWEKEAKLADFSKNTNPLYQSPEMEYTNVAYGRE